MAGRCGGCDPQSVADCQCATDDSDTIEQTGSGLSGDPFVWNVIVDPIAGNLIESSAAGMRVLLPDNISDPPHATLYLTAPVEHSDGTGAGGAQLIPFNAVDEDNRSHFVSASNGLEIVENGFYRLDLLVYWSSAVGSPKVGSRHSRIYVDGVDREVGSRTTGDTADTWSHAVGGGYFRRLAAGQLIQGLAIQNSGGNLRYAHGVNGTVLTILRVGD